MQYAIKKQPVPERGKELGLTKTSCGLQDKIMNSWGFVWTMYLFLKCSFLYIAKQDHINKHGELKISRVYKKLFSFHLQQFVTNTKELHAKIHTVQPIHIRKLNTACNLKMQIDVL